MTDGALSKFVGFAYEVVQNADGVVGIFKPPREPKRRIMRLLDSRESREIPAVKLVWDLDTMCFDVMGTISPAGDSGGGGNGGGQAPGPSTGAEKDDDAEPPSTAGPSRGPPPVDDY